MLSMSNIVPSKLQTGVLKGWRETAQKLKGRRLNVESGAFDFAIPEPALAEYASSEAHSLCVIWTYVRRSTPQGFFARTYVEFVSS
jgi:hypothetical protein